MDAVEDKMNLTEYLDALSARRSTPGGGFVAAISLAQAAALCSMVAEFTKSQAVKALIDDTTTIRKRSLQLAYADENAFQALMAASKNTSQSAENDGLPAVEAVINVSLEVIELAVKLAGHVEMLAKAGNKNLITDVAIAASLIVSAIRSSELNVLVNLASVDDSAYIDRIRDILDGRTTNKSSSTDILTVCTRMDQITLETKTRLSAQAD